MNGNSLKSIRESMNLSQTRLAEMCGISRRIINEIENGKREDVKASTLLKIATVLNVQADKLV